MVEQKKAKARPYDPRFPVRACLLYNLTTGKILYQQNANLQIPPASLTKIMTLYLALDEVKRGKISLKKKIRISRLAANTRGSSMHLRIGERVMLSKLLIGTAVPSGNDAAMAVAQAVSPNLQDFVKKMNQQAKRLGMRSTLFKNPTGLPAPKQLSTVSDMLKLAVSYLRNHPEALPFHKVSTFWHGGRILTTTNPLLGSVCGVNGLKTGWTIASGYNIIVTAEREKVRLICVIMGGKSRVGRDMTARKLIEAGFKAPNSPKGVREVLQRKLGRRGRR
ncbi:MAG: D-alanyl-D-alanine carboxypeptidase [Desulfovibrio sp.]|nr:D-alanyl-D-alanine carboxypeptidase [Desulfovibrio sp.]